MINPIWKSLIIINQNNKDALWLAPITVNGIGVYALIDSGAQRTIMTQKLLRELHTFLMKDRVEIQCRKILSLAYPYLRNIV